MKTLLSGLALTVAVASPAWPVGDIRLTFAECAGRFSAMVEHAWLMQDPHSADHAARRDQFVSLLDALGSRSDPRTLGRRIEAKAGQASLLREAAFGTDKERSDWAERHAAEQIAACRLLLLDS